MCYKFKYTPPSWIDMNAGKVDPRLRLDYTGQFIKTYMKHLTRRVQSSCNVFQTCSKGPWTTLQREARIFKETEIDRDSPCKEENQEEHTRHWTGDPAQRAAPDTRSRSRFLFFLPGVRNRWMETNRCQLVNWYRLVSVNRWSINSHMKLSANYIDWNTRPLFKACYLKLTYSSPELLRSAVP